MKPLKTKTYNIRLNDGQIDSLKSLYSRNMAGLSLRVTNEYNALSDILSQIFREDDSLDNYDHD
mgnify:CR=1 FL=1